MDFLNSLDPVIIFTLIILIISVVVHEAAHGYAALFLGDDTAEKEGRLTLNPISHLDFFGSIVIPGILVLTSAPFLFGYAKPVPYNPQKIKDKKWGDAKVAAAGPFANIFLAIIFTIILYAVSSMQNTSQMTIDIVIISIFINIFLAVFNLVPVPPLDGSKIILDFLKNTNTKIFIKTSRFFAKYSFLLFVFLIIFIINFNFLYKISNEIFNLLTFWM